jgi:CubicO group peptidase (beta-lactamase class C family)
VKKGYFYLFGFTWLLVIAILAVVSCKSGDQEVTANYVYQVPVDRGDGWPISSLSAEDIKESLIVNMIDKVLDETFKRVHGVLIVRNGNLILEEYFPGHNFEGTYVNFDWKTLHYQASCTKSFTSALIGIALDQGLLLDVNEKLSDFFPEFDTQNWQDVKKRITLKNVLTMTAGLQWDEWSFPYSDSRNSHVQMNNSGHPIEFVLQLPVVHEPGTTFVYNSGLSIILGGIIKNRTTQYADQFAEEYLFNFLGIEGYRWWKYPDGTVQTGGGLYLRPRDMAKFGQLYLQGGKWGDTRVISQRWISESVEKHVTSSSQGGYGYQWWLENFRINNVSIDSYSAHGWGGQYIYVFPGFEMVVVFTGGNYYTHSSPASRMLYNFILPAVN